MPASFWGCTLSSCFLGEGLRGHWHPPVHASCIATPGSYFCTLAHCSSHLIPKAPNMPQDLPAWSSDSGPRSGSPSNEAYPSPPTLRVRKGPSSPLQALSPHGPLCWSHDFGSHLASWPSLPRPPAVAGEPE